VTPDRRTDSLGWHDARAVAEAAASALGTETVALDESIGRVLSHDLRALTDVPHYASSAMDGWAVSGAGPWQLVDGPVLGPGLAAVIVTGGVIPVGTDAVLRSESGTVRAGRLESVSATGEPHPGQHLRAAGGEARSGELVVSATTLLNPAHVALAAGCGHDAIGVIRRPRDSPGLAEVIVTTGGTGSSAVDHLRPALHALGAEFLVSRIAMRPGGPTMLARLPDGRLLLGLPGNPLAAMMGLLTIGMPLLAAFQGRISEVGRVASAAAIEGRAGTSILVPFRLQQQQAVATPWLGSGMMRGLADSAGVLVVPPQGVRAGEVVDTLTLPWV